MQKHITYLLSLGLCLPLPAAGASSQIAAQLQQYRQQGATAADPQRGARFWSQRHGRRSCQSCHGESVRQSGSHVKTRKVILPMAPSVNARRYTDPSKVEKWFRRNCKWTLGRACSVQEKADVLAWLGSQ